MIEASYHPATPEDIPALVALNIKWQQANVDTTKNGFLRAAYSKHNFEAMIKANSIVVAYVQNEMAGYYLVNVNSEDRAVALHHSKVTELMQKGVIPSTSQVGLGTQALVDIDFQGKGLRQEMLQRLIVLLKGKYDFIFSSITKENTRAFRAHTADGWKIIDEDGTYYYVWMAVS